MLDVKHSHHHSAGGLVVNVEVHQGATPQNEIERKRARNAKVRADANKIAEVFSASMRTGARTSGANPAPLGMSVLELSPG